MLNLRAFPILFVCLFLVHQAFPQTNHAPLFTFGLITDVQYCDCDSVGSRHYRSSVRKLAQAVQTFNQKNVAFVTHLGDFIDHDRKSIDTLNTVLRSLKSPIYHVLGNHDFSVEQKEINSVPTTLRMKNRYYSFSRSGWRFIVLDGNDMSVYGQLKDSKEHQEAVQQLEALKAQNAPNGQAWNGGLGVKQINWLKAELSEAAKKGEKVLVLCHFPLMPAADPLNLWNAGEVKALLESYPNVLAYFNGHVHQPSYYTDKGIHYVTFRGMVEGEDNGFAIVEVYKDHLKINGYEQEVDRLLKARAQK